MTFPLSDRKDNGLPRMMGALLVALLTGSASADRAQDFAEAIWDKASITICGLFSLFWLIATGLAVVIITYAGIRYTMGSDDPGARKNAKEMVIHTMIALVIIFIATALVNLASGGELTPCIEPR